jgi:hypothetical protein
MEASRVVSVNREKIAPESIGERIRRREKLVISGALRQIHIEMMAFIGRPNKVQLISFFKQLASTDLDVVSNIVKDLLIKSSRSMYYIMARFRILVKAKTLIRHTWLHSRFRFAMKIQALLQKWGKDEIEIRRRLTEAKLHHRHSDDDSVMEQFLALEAPPELKRLVYLIFFKKAQREWLTKLRQWKTRTLEHAVRKEAVNRIASHAERQRQLRALALEEPPATPPQLDWYQTLHKISPTDRFEKCIQIQLSYQQKLQERSSESPFGEGGMEKKKPVALRRGSAVNATDLVAALDEKDSDTSWIALTMMGLGRHARQIDARGSEAPDADGRVRFRNRSVIKNYGYVRSKIPSRASVIDSTMSTTSPSRRQERDGGAAPATRSLAQLRSDLPTLSAMKSEPWSVPSRAVGGAACSIFSRRSEPPTLQALDPFSKSLVLRGIVTPPAPRAVAQKNATESAGGEPGSAARERLYNAHKEAMKRASQELRGMMGQQKLAEQLRSERLMKLLLEEPSKKGNVGGSSPARPSSSMSVR